jgi:hypothetical protein
MKIKMTANQRGCPDGYTNRIYMAGQEYRTPPADSPEPGRYGYICREDAVRFIAQGTAVCIEPDPKPVPAPRRSTVPAPADTEKGAQ